MIPNIVKGSGITGALAYVMGQGNDPETGERLALKPGEQSRATLLGGQNFGFDVDTAERLDLARRIMEFQGLPENQAGKTRKLDRDCFHASLSWGPGQTPSRDEMMQAGQEFLKAVGLEKARAVFVAHNDTDHAHIHIVASRIDPETRRTLNSDNDWIRGQAWGKQWEREHGQERTNDKHAGLIEAIQNRDAQAVLSYVTRDKATFQAWEVNRALAYGDLSAEDRAAFKAQIFSQKNVIGLSDTRGEEVSRYTTVEALAPEMALMSDAAKLKAQDHHAVRSEDVETAIAEFTLKPEQADALRHLTEANGLGILWGEAGTGKTHTLKATRAVHEAAGKDVRGLSWTNDVAQQMGGDGFQYANTIASEFIALEKGRTKWTRDTVLIVDEAAMISTESLGKLASFARHAGAKLILAGDDAQLSSIERGGAFETLRQKHGAAILSDVQRIENVAEQAAWGEMHKGDFRPALDIADKAGNIHWSRKQSDTLKRMAERYTADVEATPEKKRFMFAYTNADVATLNEHARSLHKTRGDLGEDHTVKTATGKQQFAEGERIQFTGNGRKQAERKAGLVNGRVGTIAGIEILEDGKPRVTVDLDRRSGEKPQQVSFVVGEDAKAGEFEKFKHGYAGTIYRGQGRTLDEVYVGHSSQWRKSTSYVALTRLGAMAKGMARADNKRAASAYFIDEEAAAQAGLDKAVAEYSDRQAAPEPRQVEAERIRRNPAVELSEKDFVDQEARKLDQIERLKQHDAQLQAFKEQVQNEAGKAQKQQHETEDKEAARRKQGEMSDAGTRYTIALAQSYNVKDPYATLGQAAQIEGATFKGEQEALRKQAANEPDPAKRQQIELRAKIEAADYMALTSERLAGMGAVIAGRRDHPDVLRDRERAGAYRDQAKELRQQREEQDQSTKRQERELIAKQTGGSAKDVEKGAMSKEDRLAAIRRGNAEAEKAAEGRAQARSTGGRGGRGGGRG